jgi:hypothetical protein
MSEPCYQEFSEWIRDAAYDMAKAYHGREPTEEEIEDEIENLLDRYT